jgi:hypothetical protein
VLILWQQTELIAKWANFPLHMRELIGIDRAIAAPFVHGQLPQEWLQQHVYHPLQLQWYDIMSSVTYALHFPLPLVVGFALWVRGRALFGRFATAFLTLAAIAFVIYIMHPAVPPWMASRHTYDGHTFAAIPPLHKISTTSTTLSARSWGSTVNPCSRCSTTGPRPCPRCMRPSRC